MGESFSAMKRIKTKLRNRMSDRTLTIALLFHKKIPSDRTLNYCLVILQEGPSRNDFDLDVIANRWGEHEKEKSISKMCSCVKKNKGASKRRAAENLLLSSYQKGSK